MKFLTKLRAWKMEQLAAKGKEKSTAAYDKRNKTGNELLLRTEDGDNQIVVSVILIVIAVGLCLIFKEQIGTIITNNITAIGSKIGDILSGF